MENSDELQARIRERLKALHAHFAPEPAPPAPPSPATSPRPIEHAARLERAAPLRDEDLQFQELVDRYGMVMSLRDVPKVLRYPSLQAAQKAHLRGTMPIPMGEMPPRRGWFTTARVVADFLSRLDKPARA